jgi:hypothetical protein
VAEQQILECRRGVDRDFLITLYDALDNPVTSYTLADAPSAAVWPGDAEAPLATPTVAWVDPTVGTLKLTIAAADTASLEVQPYPLIVKIAHAGRAFEAWTGWLDVLQGPGSAASTPVYCTYADMVRYCGPWLNQLMVERSTSGFVDERGRARSKLEEVLLARWRPRQLGRRIDLLQGYGWFANVDAPDNQLIGYLAANQLIVRPKTVEICARYAAYLACAQDIGVGDKANPYAVRARCELGAWNALLSTYIGEIDLNADGIADLTIPCSVINTRDAY